MVLGLFRRGAQAGSKGSKVTKIGSTGFFARRAMDKKIMANLGGKFKNVSKAGDNLDDAAKAAGLSKTGGKAGAYKLCKGCKVIDDAGDVVSTPGSVIGGTGNATKWKEGYRIVKVTSKIDKTTKTAKAVGVLGKAKQIGSAIPIPGIRTTFNLGVLAVIGFSAYSIISIVGNVSDRAEEVINNFYGIDCEDGDTVCEERGAKNMLLTGVLGITVVGGLLYMSLKPKGKEDKQEVEIKISKDEAATAA